MKYEGKRRKRIDGAMGERTAFLSFIPQSLSLENARTARSLLCEPEKRNEVFWLVHEPQKLDLRKHLAYSAAH
jgi:hypothetical protein